LAACLRQDAEKHPHESFLVPDTELADLEDRENEHIGRVLLSLRRGDIGEEGVLQLS
jgi:hypothetical protein